MAVGFGSAVVNGQLAPMMQGDFHNPVSYGPPLETVPASAPQIPPFWGSLINTPNNTGAQAQGNSAAKADPFNLGVSPVVWAIIFVLISVLGLRFIHYH